MLVSRPMQMFWELYNYHRKLFIALEKMLIKWKKREVYKWIQTTF